MGVALFWAWYFYDDVIEQDRQTEIRNGRQRWRKLKMSDENYHVPYLVSVQIFVENRTFLNFGWVGHGCGRSTGQRLSGPTFSDLSF